MDKPISFYAFEVLYWCGLRLGELLALTPADFDLEKKVLRITKSYQRSAARISLQIPKLPSTKLVGCDNGTFVLEGKMLNAPHADFGVTYGDTVIFGTGIVDEQGTRMCIALLQKK